MRDIERARLSLVQWVREEAEPGAGQVTVM
jgi:hypothetical protein